MSFWENKSILVTGASGFLGQHLVARLKEEGANVITPSHKDYDLVDGNDVRKMYADNPNIDQVIHLAAKVGGIGANREHPGSFMYDNLMMGVQLIHEGYKAKLPKFVALGTVCAYPKFTPVPFKEDDLWNGYPEETNAPYGLAKKMMPVQSEGYREALIKKCVDAVDNGDDEIVVWGTGKASREFLFVDDVVDGILLASEKYDKSEPVNLGSSYEVTIKDLVDIIVEATGFKGKITWDSSKPDGQPRRKLDVSRAEKEFGFTSKTSFPEGLKKTIEWYRNDLLKQSKG